MFFIKFKGYWRNITIFYLVTFFSWLSFWLPIYVLFYQSIGLTYTQILLMTTARSIVNLILVIPTGIFADLFGRKKSLIIASIFQISGFALMYFSTNFITVFIANILVGTYFAFLNGADIALVYDSLKAEKGEKNFKVIQSLISGITLLALSFASLVGGVLSSVEGFRFVIMLNVIAYTIGLIITMFLKEPPHERSDELVSNDYVKHLKTSIKILLNNTNLIIISVLFAAFTLVAEVGQSFNQPLLKMTGLDIKYFGIINAVFLIVAGSFSLGILYKVKDKFKISRQMVITMLVLIFQFIILSTFLNTFVAIVFICLGQILKGTSTVFIKDYSNKVVTSKERATMFSIQGFITSIFSIIFTPVFGYFADTKGIQYGYLSMVFFLIIMSVILLLFYFVRRNRAVNIN